ncbi:MAG: DUF2191 domain-containing protein [Candidatus Aminicenantes bacterium]|nr:DUF2191 domain-containing protein [Candidatus Aminicenantes bacterium]
MKTTIHIPDSLFKEAKKVAQQEKTTLKALVEEGLRKVMAEHLGRRPEEFKLRRVAFKGQGLQPHVASVTWDQILDLSYEGRGG